MLNRIFGNLGTGIKVTPNEKHKANLMRAYQLPNRVSATGVIKASNLAGQEDAKTSLLAKMAQYQERIAENELAQYEIRANHAKAMNKIETKLQRLDGSLRKAEASTALSQAENYANLGGYEQVFMGTESVIDL